MSPTPRTASFECVVGIPQAAAFEFFSEVPRLNEVTPPWFRLDPVAGVPGTLETGATIDYRFRWRLLRLRWRSRITDWRPPEFFAYEQERGPYRYFRHEHRFVPLVGGGTRVIDTVRFRTVGGPLLDRWLVEPELERIFAFRREVARERFPLAEHDSMRGEYDHRDPSHRSDGAAGKETR